MNTLLMWSSDTVQGWGKGTSPNYKPKKNGKKWVEGKKYLNTVVPKVDKVAPKILMRKMEEILK